MKANEFLTEKWSQKYKSSINCSHPRGFSQRAHCAGKKKHNESVEMEMVCEDCGMCQTHGNLTELRKGEKDSNGYTRCWPGKHAEGTKRGKNGGQVRNCVPNESEELDEIDRRGFLKGLGATAGLAAMGGAKGQTPDYAKLAKYTAECTGTFMMAQSFYKNTQPRDDAFLQKLDQLGNKAFNASQAFARAAGLPSDFSAETTKSFAKNIAPMAKNDREMFVQFLNSSAAGCKNILDRFNESVELAEEFDLIESIIEDLAQSNGVDSEMIWEDLETLDDDELYVFATTSTIMETEAWQKANNRDRTDGMSRKAVNTYRREHPGSKLQTAVTTKPSKLKKGSKASKRRKSYCSRSRGQMKMHNISCAKTPDKAICKARRRWNC